MVGQLDAIVALQTTLDELDAANERLGSIPDWMQELHEEHSSKKNEIQAASDSALAADKTRREAEGELADAQAKLKQYQEQIGRVSTQREYGALLKEIDTVKERINNAEKLALDALAGKEEAEEQQKGLEENFQELDERYQTELSKWEAEKPEVEEHATELRQRAEDLRADIPKNLQTLMGRLRERLAGKAIAEVRKMKMPRSNNAMWHCSACSYNVRPQIVVEIRNNGSLNQCESCKRVLFLVPEPEAEEE